MNDNRISKFNQIEIEDLIIDSVTNAVERRKLGLNSKEFLSELSDDEAKLTKGGVTNVMFGHRPIQFPTKV